jgi:hypothetical protein
LETLPEIGLATGTSPTRSLELVVSGDWKGSRSAASTTPYDAVDQLVSAIKARDSVQHVIHVLHWGAVKTNVTLELDADLLREARVVAAEEGRSISALLTDRLEAIVRERKAFDKARRRALARLREGLDLQWTRPSTRDELHER